MASISNRKIGTLTLDITTNEEHESSLRITDNPIESGVVISDHAVLEPKQITIEGMIISYEPSSSVSFNKDYTGIRTPDFIDNVSFGDLSLFTPVTLFKMSQLTDVLASNIRPLGNYTFKGFDSSSFGNGINSRIARIQADFEQLQGNGDTIEINTGTKLYKNMLIAMFGVTQSTDGSAIFRITGREVTIVETSSTGILAGIKKAGRTAVQAANKTVRGDVSTKEVPAAKKKSMLETGSEWWRK